MKKTLSIIAILFFLLGIGGPVPAEAETIKAIWDANSEADLAGYKLYSSRASGGPYVVKADVGNATAYTIDISGEADGIMYFVVTAYDNNGNESEYSNEVSWTIDHTAPAPPTGCRVVKIPK